VAIFEMPFDAVKPLEGEQTFVRLQEVSPKNNKPNNNKTVYNHRKPHPIIYPW
jgi:hypothetical protein